jgi:hypothetical protein
MIVGWADRAALLPQVVALQVRPKKGFYHFSVSLSAGRFDQNAVESGFLPLRKVFAASIVLPDVVAPRGR